jgi:hypothetical protein
MNVLPLSLVPGLGLLMALGACVEQGGTDRAGAGAVEGCQAEANQAWVGQSVAVLNDVDLPEGTRVLFPTTPATMDFNEDRMNVTVDKSDLITRVYCG